MREGQCLGARSGGAVHGIAPAVQWPLHGGGDRRQSVTGGTLSNVTRRHWQFPWQPLVAFGRDELQRNPNIRRLYGEAAGLAHFLMDDQDGRYRENFADYLAMIYQLRDRPDTFATVTRTDLGALEKQYHAFLKNVSDEDLKSLRLMEGAKRLCLGQTAVTDVGLAKITGTRSLEWLELGTTQITDAGLKVFRPATGLKQLFLEQTEVSNVSLDWIGTLRELEELDLSKTRVTDAGLAKLSGLRNLKKLYLFNCDITDAGLIHLKSLRQLDELEVGQTKVTAEALANFKRSLPKSLPMGR